MRTHLHWSIEGPNNTCPTCGDKTVLVIAKIWDADEESAIETIGKDRYDDECGDGDQMVDAEVTGHLCLTCHRLCSIAVNTPEVKS